MPSKNKSKTYDHHGTEEPSKATSSDSKAHRKGPSKGRVTYTYLPLQDPPQRPKPELAKEPASYTHVPPQMVHQAPVVPFAMGPCHAPVLAYAPIFFVDQARPVLTPYVASGQLVYPVPVAVPEGTVLWNRPTKVEVDAQNAKIAAEIGATKLYQATPGLQCWVKELDGAVTLRTTSNIMENCQPGRWAYASAGYPCFVREKPAEAPATP
ncbi:hypothetical protein VTN02DRAFT_2597 [Thermoascus thermophilus]